MREIVHVQAGQCGNQVSAEGRLKADCKSLSIEYLFGSPDFFKGPRCSFLSRSLDILSRLSSLLGNMLSIVCETDLMSAYGKSNHLYTTFGFILSMTR